MFKMSGEIISTKIVDIIDENPYVKSFYLVPKKRINTPKPGQFFMVWVPGYEEIPISASGFFSGIIRITVARVGETTERMHGMNIGDYIGLKGPLGTYIPIKKAKYLLIAGGYGAAPLIFATRELKKIGVDVTFAEGARDSSRLLFIDEAISLGARVIISTEDGSFGFKGTILDHIKSIINYHDVIVACGPKGLLDSVSYLIKKNNKEGYILAESYMKCGLGLCGSCVLGKSGLLVCRDGPVFKNDVYFKAVLE